MAYPPWKFLVIDCNSKILPDMPFFLFQLFSSYTTFENNSIICSGNTGIGIDSEPEPLTTNTKNIRHDKAP
jgi:hypothetical protein